MKVDFDGANRVRLENDGMRESFDGAVSRKMWERSVNGRREGVCREGGRVKRGKRRRLWFKREKMEEGKQGGGVGRRRIEEL